MHFLELFLSIEVWYKSKYFQLATIISPANNHSAEEIQAFDPNKPGTSRSFQHKLLVSVESPAIEEQDSPIVSEILSPSSAAEAESTNAVMYG